MFLQLCLVKFSISPIIPGAFTFIVLFKQDCVDPSHILSSSYSGNMSLLLNFIQVSLSSVARIYVVIIYIIFENVTVWVQIKVNAILSL